MKYILVTGGVISGVGKGVIASSFGTILKCCGINVTSIKIDPYINIDAGTFSPYEHGKITHVQPGALKSMITLQVKYMYWTMEVRSTWIWETMRGFWTSPFIEITISRQGKFISM